jgi:hypothetical protein
MNATLIIIVGIAAIALLLVIAVIGLLIFRNYIRGLQRGQGPMGSVIQQSREIAKENVEVARERLLVERELLAAQKETNELLKQIVAKKQT